MKRIYFDHNATTPINNKVKSAMDSICNLALNSSSLHYHGRYARKILENARDVIKNSLGFNNTHELIFTSGCTEANNLALHNFSDIKKICSCIEHPAVINVIGEGIIPVDNNGMVNIDYIENYLIENNTKKLLVSVMYANNEIGTIQPIQKIAQLAKKYNFIFHCDITQAIGRIDVDLTDIDLITFSSHKFGGPVGSGALIYNKTLDLKPMVFGGGQEFRLRSGTQNITAIYGMATAFESIEDIKKNFTKTKQLQQHLEQSLKNIKNDVVIFGEKAARLPNTSSISMPKASPETQLIFFDLNGISLSAGSACSSGKIDIPRIQLSMGYPQEIADNSIRVSLGPNNTIGDIDTFINLWKNLYLRNN